MLAFTKIHSRIIGYLSSLFVEYILYNSTDWSVCDDANMNFNEVALNDLGTVGAGHSVLKVNIVSFLCLLFCSIICLTVFPYVIHSKQYLHIQFVCSLKFEANTTKSTNNKYLHIQYCTISSSIVFTQLP